MDRETRRKIIEDYKKVNNNVLRILEGGPNFFVKNEHYVIPTIMFTPVPFDDPRGELEYFKEIRDGLEEILTHEKTFIRIPHAPDYLKEFID